jgi:hypothetical protein
MEIICIHDGRIKYGMKEFVHKNLILVESAIFLPPGDFILMGGKKLTPCSTVLFEQKTVSQLITKFPPFMEPEVLLPCLLMPAIETYIQPNL